MNSQVYFCVFLTLIVCVIAVSANGGGWSDTYRKQDSHGKYAFGYKIVDKKGAKQSRSEEGDGWTKHGHYSLHDVDGRQRYVSYVADKKGFRAKIETNEPGTGNVDAANAIYNGPDPQGYSDTHVESGSSGSHGHDSHDSHGQDSSPTEYKKDQGGYDDLTKAYLEENSAQLPSLHLESNEY